MPKYLKAIGLVAVLAFGSLQAMAADLITGQSISGITSTGVTVNWTTCAAASSQVNYGLTNGYGSQTTLDPTLLTSHSQSITGLTAGMLYHYVVVSVDSSGNTLQSADGTFIPTGGQPTVTLNPSNVTVCNGSVVSFTATASGTPTPAIQWKQSTDGGTTYSNVSSASAPINFIQANDSTSVSSASSQTAVFTNAQTVGNLNFVAVSWGDVSHSVSSITDTQGNIYSQIDLTGRQTSVSQAIYYAKNIKAGANTVSVTFNATVPFPDVRVAEYSGLDTANPLDARFTGQGTVGSVASTNPVPTGSAIELIMGAGAACNPFSGAGTNFTSRLLTSPSGNLLEDRTVSTINNYAATGPVSGCVVIQMATFKAASQTQGGNTYSFTALASQNGYKYEAVFTNAAGSATTTPATLTVNTPPVVSTQPLATSVSSGNTATFTAASSGGSPGPTVQWQLSTDGGGTWANVVGATSTTLNLTGTVVGQNGNKYRAVFTNSCATVNSNPATLTVTSSNNWNISQSSSSSRSGGTFLQGATLSGTTYIFTSLASNQATFSLSGVSKVSWWLDDILMAGPGTGSVFASPFDFNAGNTIPTFVQVNAATPQTPTSPVTVTYTQAQTAGNLNVVVVGRSNGTASVMSVVDSKGNTYANVSSVGTGAVRQGIWYAKNIVSATAGANTVTVAFDVAPPFPDVRILEYSGLDATNPLDNSQAASGTGVTADSGGALTSFANDLIFGAGTTAGVFTVPAAGFATRILTTPDKDIAFDKNVNATASYNASATVSPSAAWVMQMVAFRAASSVLGWDTTKVTNGTHTITQVVTPVSGSPEVDTATFTLSNAVSHFTTASWVKGTAANNVTYNVYRATGSCSGSPTWTRIASGLGSPSYTDNSVAGGTSYCYSVSQVDTVTAQESPKSSFVTAVIP